MKIHIYLLVFILSPFLWGCTEDYEIDNHYYDLQCESTDDNETRVLYDSTFYATLPDPYALDNMQSVYDEILGTDSVTLSPTHLYVRFKPRNNEDLMYLINRDDLILSPIPLDADIDEEEYLEAINATSEFCPLYTTVNSNFSFPSKIKHEIIRECYIPSDRESISTTRGDVIDIESAAYLKLGYEIDIELNSESSNHPTGNFKVSEVYPNLTNDIPLNGVQIICHRFSKIRRAYTDKYGNYTINDSFVNDPYYKIVFRNRLGFTIWGNWGFMFPAQQTLGKQSKSGFSKIFNNSDKCWEWCAVNNSTRNYYDSCVKNDIKQPPSNLKIWVLKNQTSSSAPMLRRISSHITTNWGSNWIERLINSLYGNLATFLIRQCKLLLPDIFIGTSSSRYDIIYGTVHHELSHASHFMNVGEEYWARYIGYIMTNWGYGEGTGIDAELCGIGEMWGYAMEYSYRNEEYNYPSISEYIYPGSVINGWIKPHVIWDLIKMMDFSKKQIYDSLTAEVDTYLELLNQLITLYPDKFRNILAVFLLHGYEFDIERDQSTIYISNTTYYRPYAEYGYSIDLSNFEVSEDSNLTILFEDKVSLSESFHIDRNAKLEIKDVY